MTTLTPAKLSEVEASIAANAAELKAENPEAYDKLQKVLAALKKAPAGKPYSDEVKKLTVEVVQASFDAQLVHYREQYAEAKAQADQTRHPAAVKVAAALGEVVSFLEEAKAAGLPPSDKAAAALEARVPRLQALLAEATEASKALTQVPLTPVKGPLVSPGGVALKAVQPPPRAAAVGEAMAALSRAPAPAPARPAAPLGQRPAPKGNAKKKK